MTDPGANILESSLNCCSKCKGLFRASKEENEKHWITCSGNPFKSPTTYFACERKIFLQLFQPEDFQLDGSFNLQNISKDDSFLNQVVKIRLPQETIDPFMFLRNYTSTGPSALQESDLDLLGQNISDLDPSVEKDVPFVGDEKTSYGTHEEEDQIQKIINKNIDYLKHDEIPALHSSSTKGPFTESPPESRLLSPIEKHLNFLSDGTKSGLQSPFDKSDSFLPDAAVPYQGSSLGYGPVQSVPFSCRSPTDLLADLSASQDGNQTLTNIGEPCPNYQHLDLQKKDPFLGQNPGLAQINSKDPFLINASVPSDKGSLAGQKYVPPSTRHVFDMQTSPTFQLQESNYFNFPSMLDEPTQLDYLDLATIDFITNPSLNFGQDKNEPNNVDTSSRQEQANTNRTIGSFENHVIFPTETRDDSAVDRKTKRLRMKKIKTRDRLPKRSRSSTNTENGNSSSRVTEASPRSRRHSSRETEKAVMKIIESNKLVGQSNEAPENSTDRPKLVSRKRKLSLPSTLELGPLEGQTKTKNERKSSGKSRLCQSGDILNIKDNLTGFTDEEKDTFKAVLGKNTCVLVKKQKLMPFFKPKIVGQLNEVMGSFYKRNAESNTKETFVNVKESNSYTVVKNSRSHKRHLSENSSSNYTAVTIDNGNENKSISSSPRKPFMFTCNECDYTCASVSMLANHVKILHPRVDNNIHLDTCNPSIETELEPEIDVVTDDTDNTNIIDEQNIAAFHQKARNCSLKQAAVTRFSLESDNIYDRNMYNDIPTLIDGDEKQHGNVSVDNSETEVATNAVFYATPVVASEQASNIIDLNQNVQIENRLNFLPTNVTNIQIDDVNKFNLAALNLCSDKIVPSFYTNYPSLQTSEIQVDSPRHSQDDSLIYYSSEPHVDLITANTQESQDYTHDIIGPSIPSVSVDDIINESDATETSSVETLKVQTKHSRIKSISVLKIKDIHNSSDGSKKDKCKFINLKVITPAQKHTHDRQAIVLTKANGETNVKSKKVKPETIDKETSTDPDICRPDELELDNVNVDNVGSEGIGEHKDVNETNEQVSNEIHNLNSADIHVVEHAYSQVSADDNQMVQESSTERDHDESRCEAKEKKTVVSHKSKDTDQPHPFMCDQCTFGCEKKASLNTHKEKCHGDFVYCTVTGCEFKTRYKRNLALHKLKHEGVKRFLCDKCPYSTSDATCFSSHQKHNHSDAVKFKCTDCDFVSILRLEILRHYRNIHLRQKIYACNQCDYKTGYTSLLKSHLMAHAGIRPYKCSICDYQVCSLNKVNWHIKHVHLGRTDAKCIKLDLTFEIDAKQFKCAEPTNEKDIKVIELTDEEVKIYVEKKRKEAELKKAEKDRKEKLKLQKLEEKNINNLRKMNLKNKSKSNDIKMVSLLGDLIDLKKID